MRTTPLILFLSWLSFLVCDSEEQSVTNSFRASELLSLQSFYNSTNGQYWTWDPFSDDSGIPWNFTSLNVNPCSDSWQGLSCIEVTSDEGTVYDTVVELELPYFNLSGFISNDGVRGLTNLQEIMLTSNSIGGPIPTAFASLESLQMIYLSFNRLSGTIPAWFGQMTNLTFLELTNNRLSGTIPSSLGYLHNLKALELFSNALTGRIPEELYDLQSLLFFMLQDNFLTGTVSSKVGQFIAAQGIYFNGNLFSGSIPSEISQLSNLVAIDFNSNRLSGELPADMTSFSNLLLFDVYNNILTGSIPASVGHWASAVYFDVSLNQFIGSIPSEVTEQTQVADVYFSVNYLTGSFPAQIGDCTNLQLLDAYRNHLTGPLPFLRNVTYLYSLVAYENYLTGSLDRVVSYDSTSLYTVELSSNQITGTIPDMSSLTSLIFMGLSNNRLSGTVGDMFSFSPVLSVLLLSDNKLSGPVTQVINATRQKSLIILDVSDNRFTGELPSFSAHLLLFTTLAAAVNCIRTPLSTDLCSMEALEVLVLDGLNAAEGCKSDAHGLYSPFGGTSQSLGSRSGVKGSIPTCLFTMQSLRTLHLSGNELSGDLPSELLVDIASSEGISIVESKQQQQKVSASLRQLSLSHNAFTGSIPDWIWNHENWTELDLSFNRFYGHIPDSSTLLSSVNASVYLDLNRLSGIIPGSLYSVDAISILNGNIFSCDVERSNLPVHDTSRTSYVCGSDTINNGLVLWLALVAMCVLGWLLLRYRKQVTRPWPRVMNLIRIRVHSGTRDTGTERVEGKGGAISPAVIEGFEWFLMDLGYVVRMLLWCTGALLTLFIPIYAALTVNYGSYETQYAWTLSASYLEGVTPAAILLLIFVLFIIVYDRMFRTQQCMALRRRDTKRQPCLATIDASRAPTADASPTEEEGKHQRENTTPSILMLTIVRAVRTLVVLCDAVLVIVLNGAYVYLLTQKQPTVVLAFTTLALSIFKIGWGWLVVNKFEMIARQLLWWILSLCQGSTVDRVAMSASLTKAKLLPMYGTQSNVSITLFNNIVAPYCAEMFASPNCFLYVFTAVPQVTSSYEIDRCSDRAFSVTCTVLTQNISYQPAFSYDYLCSASLVTSFTFVFLVRYVLTGVIIPLWLLLVEWATVESYRRFRRDRESMWGCIRAETAFKALLWLQPYRQRPQEWFIDKYGLKDSKESADQTVVENPLTIREREGNSSLVTATITSDADHFADNSLPPGRDLDHHSVMKLGRLLSSRKDIIVRTVNDVALFVTYGVLFPPLAVIIVLSMVVDVWQLLERWHGVLSVVEIAAAGFHGQEVLSMLRSLSEDFGRFERSIFPALRRLSFLAALFWSFTLLDTLGGAQGALQAAWIAVVMSSAPVWLFVLRWLSTWLCKQEVCLTGSPLNSALGRNSKDAQGGLPRQETVTVDVELGQIRSR